MINTDKTKLWMVPFADLMSCLVILFLALYGFSVSANRTDFEAALANLQKDLGVKGADQKLEEINLTKKVEADLAKQIAEGNLGIEITADKIKLTFASPILFDLGSAELKEEARLMLKPVVANLIKMNNPVIVEGHTDSVPVKGKKFRSNRELSLFRAFSVIDFLIKENFFPEKLSAFGYGEHRPVAENDTEEGRAKNRRIEITILRQKT